MIFKVMLCRFSDRYTAPVLCVAEPLLNNAEFLITGDGRISDSRPGSAGGILCGVECCMGGIFGRIILPGIVRRGDVLGRKLRLSGRRLYYVAPGSGFDRVGPG